MVAVSLHGFVRGGSVALLPYMNPAYRLWEFVSEVVLALLARRGELPNIRWRPRRPRCSWHSFGWLPSTTRSRTMSVHSIACLSTRFRPI